MIARASASIPHFYGAITIREAISVSLCTSDEQETAKKAPYLHHTESKEVLHLELFLSNVATDIDCSTEATVSTQEKANITNNDDGHEIPDETRDFLTKD